MIHVSLRHRFATRQIEVDFAAPGGVTALFGASGAGKTTVIDAVAGLLRPDTARIEIDGEVLVDTVAGRFVPPHRRRVGYVFQDARLFPHLDVAGNLDYGARVTGRRPAPETRARVVEMLGLGPLLARRPAALSGGEKQRVALGRALLAAPRLLLLDEPLAALDAARKAEILPYLERIRDEAGVPMLYVSHAASEVARLASHVVVLDQGRVLRAGSAAQVLGDPAVAPTGPRDIGAVIEARVVTHHADGMIEIDAAGAALFLTRCAAPAGATIRIRIAAHDVILSTARPEGLSAMNLLAGTVTGLREIDGPEAIVTLATPAGALLARVTRRSVARLSLAEGMRVYAILKSVAIAPDEIGRAP